MPDVQPSEVAVASQLQYTRALLQFLCCAAQSTPQHRVLPVQVLATFKGEVLEGCHYTHPLYERVSPLVIGGDYITTDSGTGLVHTAPGHGQEDYQVSSSCRISSSIGLQDVLWARSGTLH
jgi:isoleucyl-tRNA synthetase